MSHSKELPAHLLALASELVAQCQGYVPELTPYTRHNPACSSKDDNCNCKKSLYISRTPNSPERRVSTYTRSWEQAGDFVRQMRKMFDPEKRELIVLRHQVAKETERKQKTITDALKAWIVDKESKPHAKNSMKIYYTILNQLPRWAHQHGLQYVHQLDTEQLTLWRNGWRNKSKRSLILKQGRLVNFCQFSVRMGWLKQNPAGGRANPNGGLTPITGRDKVPDPPFTREQYQQILQTCDRLPIPPVEALKDLRVQVRNYIELIRWSSFAPIDALKFRHNQLGADNVIGNGRHVVRRQKNNKATGGELPWHVADNLRAMPAVRDALPGYFFYDGADDDTLTKKWASRVQKVFELCDPPLEITNSAGEKVNPHPYLLRHTFAVEYLEAGGDIHDLAKLMGNTVKEIEKSYVDYSPKLKARIVERQRATFAAQGVRPRAESTANVIQFRVKAAPLPA